MSFDPHSNPYQPASGSFGPPKPMGPPDSDPLPLILGIVSVVTGLSGLLTCVCCLFLPFPVVSLATGIPVLFMKADQTAKTIAIVGVICGGLSIVALILAFALGFAGAVLDAHAR